MADQRYGVFDKRLMLDTGVIKNVFHKRKDGNEMRFWDSVNAISYTKTNAPFFVSTALMGVELLGFKIQDLDPSIQDAKLAAIVKDIFSKMTAETIHDGLEKILSLYMGWLDKHSPLSSEALLQRNADELVFRAHWAGGLMDLVVGSRLADPGLRKAFLRNIAYDRTQAIPYEEFVTDQDVLKKIDVAFLNASLIDLAEDRAISPCRIIDRLLVRAGKAVQGNDYNRMYEDDDGSVDTEIVYYATVGHKNLATDRLDGIVAFTTERLDRWRPRIEALIGALRYLDEAKRKVSDPLVLRPGLLIRVCDKTGMALGVIDVRNEFNFIDLLCDQDRTFQNWNKI